MAAKSMRFYRITTASLVAMALMLATASAARADQPIVGMWRVVWDFTLPDGNGANPNYTVLDQFHSDGLENETDITPILLGNVCNGTWIHLQGRTYGLAHPYFNFDGVKGLPVGSGIYYCTLTVTTGGNEFSGKCIVKNVEGYNPLDPAATVENTFGPVNVSATRVTVDTSQLP